MDRLSGRKRNFDALARRALGQVGQLATEEDGEVGSSAIWQPHVPPPFSETQPLTACGRSRNGAVAAVGSMAAAVRRHLDK